MIPVTVYLIDDDQDDIDILKEAISKINKMAVCMGFIYPEQAVKSLMTADLLVSPDFIFIDINMPVVSGDKCLKLIRSESRFDNIVIIMYSTSMPDGVAETLKKNGANYVFEKPIRLADYYPILNEIME